MNFLSMFSQIGAAIYQSLKGIPDWPKRKLRLQTDKSAKFNEEYFTIEVFFCDNHTEKS